MPTLEATVVHEAEAPIFPTDTFREIEYRYDE